MLTLPISQALWQMMSPILPSDTQRFMSAFYEVAGESTRLRPCRVS